MTPKRANDLIPEYARELGMDESLVRGILNQFWGMTQDQLDTGVDSVVNVAGLGRFMAVLKEVDRTLEHRKKHGIDKSIYTNRTVSRLKTMRVEIVEQARLFEEKRKLRRIIKSGSTETLEEPEADI